MVEAVVSGSEVGKPVIPVAISNPETLQVAKCESCPPISLSNSLRRNDLRRGGLPAVT